MLEKLNKYFDKAYVMTIKRLQREELFKEQLKGLNYEVVYGIDGYEDPDYEDYVKYPKNLPGHLVLNRPNLGCTKSHIMMYRKMLDDGVEKALVMEDDNLLTPSIANIDEYFAQVPDKFDVLYLGFNNKHFNYDQYLHTNYSKNLFKMTKANKIDLEGANAQIITRNVAQKLYDFQREYHCTGDGVYTELLIRNNLTYYAFVPQLMVQKI